MFATSAKRKVTEEERQNKEERKQEARERRQQAALHAKKLERYFDTVKAAVEANESTFTFDDDSMSTFVALAAYANEHEVQGIDRFNLIWNLSNYETKLWIWDNIQNLILNQPRKDKLLVQVHDLQQPLSLRQDASNPYFITRGYLIK